MEEFKLEKIENEGEEKNGTQSRSFEKEKEDIGNPSKSSEWGTIFPYTIEAINKDFPTSASLIILLGYIVMNSFGKNGADLIEYGFFILFLGAIYYILKNQEACLRNFSNFLKGKSFFVGSLILLLTYLILRFQEPLLTIGSTIFNSLLNIIKIVFKS